MNANIHAMLEEAFYKAMEKFPQYAAPYLDGWQFVLVVETLEYKGSTALEVGSITLGKLRIPIMGKPVWTILTWYGSGTRVGHGQAGLEKIQALYPPKNTA